MTGPTDGTSVPPADALPPPQAVPDDLGGGGMSAAFDHVRLALTERARLLSLEFRLAGLTLVQMVMYAVVVAVLVVSSWLGLMGAIVAGVMTQGMSVFVGLGIGILLNLVLAALLVKAMVSMFSRVDFQATLRRLRGDIAREDADPQI